MLIFYVVQSLFLLQKKGWGGRIKQGITYFEIRMSCSRHTGSVSIASAVLYCSAESLGGRYPDYAVAWLETQSN